MIRKIISIFIMILLMTIVLSISVFAGDENNPEVIDRVRDVKLFGIIPFLPQFNFKSVDIISNWFYEDSNSPDYVNINLKIMDLEPVTEKYDAIYVISWSYDNIGYSASVHIFPEGATSLIAGRTDEEGNDYVDYVICDGIIDDVNNIIKWIVPKDAIGNPTEDNKLIDIHPHTHLRFTENSGLPLIDLFKDLSWNAKISKDYIIKY